MGSSVLAGLNQFASQSGALFGSGGNTGGFTEASKIASTTAALIGAAGALTPELAAFASMAGPIGMAAAAVLLIIGHIFHGADPNQVPAAQIEQCFEAAADNFYALCQSGYMTAAEAEFAMQRLIQAGDSYYQQAVSSNPQYARDPRPFTNGQKNMTQVINHEISLLSSVPVRPLIPLDAAAQALYIQDGSRGWYSGPGQSIDAATSLTNGFMTALRQAYPVETQASTPAAQASSVATETAAAPVSASAAAVTNPGLTMGAPLTSEATTAAAAATTATTTAAAFPWAVIIALVLLGLFALAVLVRGGT